MKIDENKISTNGDQMLTENICDQCGTSLHSDSPGGACPNCLMGLAMKGTHDPTSAPNQIASGTAGLAFDIPDAEQLVGKFPNLEIEHLVGRGGMGAVYKAQQTNLGRSVALKILSPRLGNDPSFTERFAREARTLARLTHPNIVTVFDFGSTDSMPYLVMEYIDGVNLRDAIQIGRIQPERALEIVQQICEALQYAHDSGIIHRDIKPENILINRRGDVKIADFGLAKLLEPTPEEFTLTGTRQVMGTMNYMAPEQIEKPQTVDHRADLYSLGVVFYELLTGELPIGRFAPPSEKARCGTGLDEVVLRTLEKEPKRRFQQASQIKTAVETLDSAQSVARASAEMATSPPRSNFYSGKPISGAIPFTIGWVKGKLHKNVPLAKATGIARAFEDRVELEIELNESLTETQIVKATIPIEQIASIDYQGGLFRKRIRLQTTSLDAVKGIPGALQGAVTLRTDWTNEERAENFANQVDWQLKSNLSPTTDAARPPIKSPQVGVTEEEIIVLDERMKVPRSGLLFCSGLQMLACFGFFIAAAFQYTAWTTGQHGWYGSDYSFDMMLMFLAWSIGSSLTSVLLFFVARNIQQHLNYPFVITGLVACLFIPFSPVTFAQIPFAIWSLVIMCLRRTREVFFAETMDVRMAARTSQTNFHPEKQLHVQPPKTEWKFIGVIFGIAGALIAGIVALANFSDYAEYGSSITEVDSIGQAATPVFFSSPSELSIVIFFLALVSYGIYRIHRAFFK